MISNKKVFVIALFGLMIGSIAFAAPGDLISSLTNITCYDCTLDNPSFVNYTFPPGNQTNSFDDIYVNNISVNTSESIYLKNNLYVNDYFHIENINRTQSIEFMDNTLSMFYRFDGIDALISLENEKIVNQVSNGSYSQSIQTEANFTYNIRASDILKITSDGVDLNNHNITNNPQITALESGKVNKTGDKISGSLNLQNNSLLNVSNFYGDVKINKEGLNAVVVLNNTLAPYSVAMRQNYLGSISFITNWNTDTDTRINTSYPIWIFRIRAPEDDFQVIRSPDGVSWNVYFSINKDGNLTIPTLAGTGNSYLCVNSGGTFYRCTTP